MGKSSSVVTGYHYRPAFHQGLCRGPIDAYLEWRVADKTAWSGELTASGQITIAAPFLFGGPKDQGGVEGALELMFGEADQEPNSYLASTFGPQQPAWRGLATMVFKGGRYGANNPYAQTNSSKVTKIKQGWDSGECWYEERAAIPMALGEVLSLGPDSPGWRYRIGPGSDDYIDPAYDDSDWDIGSAPFASATGHPYVSQGGYPDEVGTVWPIGSTIWVRRRFNIPNPFSFALEIFVDNYATVWVNGNLVLPRVGSTLEPSDAAFRHPISIPQEVLLPGDNVIVLKAEDEGIRTYAAFKITSQLGGLFGMNPAHALVYSRTDSERGREPFEGINEASLTLAADTLFGEGFGICTMYDPANESVEEFEGRICRVIGASFERSVLDGRWYLDLARQDYELDELPILTDDDILDFREQPTTLDRAVNSLSVRYFDVQRKESVVTPAVRALGLVRQFGEIHETLDFPEIPVGSLALRVAERELRARVTPTRGFRLVTTPETYAWRRGQRFRLQSVKRGIADMVCILGQKERGTLKSGAINLVATQDIYGLPDASYVEIEPGVDPNPVRRPEPIAPQRADEVPYVELAARLPRAEFAALPPDVGFVMGTASDPTAGRDFTMVVAPEGGEFDQAGTGYWCPTATTAAAAGREPGPLVVELATAYQLDQVQVGSGAWWGDELVRVDATDPDLLTVTLGRGCGDTVPQPHVAGSRIWFYDAFAAFDSTEYTDGETVDVKLLSNTGSAQLSPLLATAMPVTLDQRAARPYPPAGLQINGEAEPATAIGDLVLTWAHRDRVLQADQLVDDSMASIGPEPGTTCTARYFLGGVLQGTQAGIAGTTTTYTPAGAGLWRIELESVRDGLTSWQMHVRELVIGAPLLAEDGALITTEDDQPILME